MVRTLTAHGSVFVDPDTPRDLDVLVSLLRQLDVEVANLAPLADVVRDEVVRQCLYPVTAPNLRSAVKAGTISLDSLWADQDVYGHARAHLRTYLDGALPAGEVTLRATGPWRDVVNDLAAHEANLLQEVMARSADDVRVTSLDEVDGSAWAVLARTGRFAPTASNLARYFEARSADNDLAAYLTLLQDHVELDLVEPENSALALDLINSALLPPTRLVPLAQRLEPTPFAMDDLTASAAPCVPLLVAAGLLPDDSRAYQAVRTLPWSTRHELVLASATFPSYLADLELDREELRALATQGDVPTPVKEALLGALTTFEAVLDAPTATALAQWAHAQGHTLGMPHLTLLADRGASPTSVLDAASPQIGSLTWDEIVPLLTALGSPFDELRVTGERKALWLPASGGLKALLRHLEALGRVTSFDEGKQPAEVLVRRKVNPPS